MLLIGRMWTLEIWINKAVNQGLMGHISSSIEDRSAESNVDCDAPVKVFQKRRISVSGL